MWKKAIQGYEEGIITQTELKLQLFRSLTEENVQEFLQESPRDILEEMIREINRAPCTDEEWEAALVFSVSMWTHSADIKKYHDQLKSEWRRGVEILRHQLGE